MADERGQSNEIKNLLKLHSSLKLKTTNEGIERVVCELTSHEMPCTVQAIQAYVNGKKYKCQVKNRLTEKEQQLCSEYLELKKRGQLYCKLTKKYINNLPHHIRQHLEGRKFKKALQNGPHLNLHKQSPNHDVLKGETDQDDDMWIPSESESESIGDECLENKFNTEKTVTPSDEDNSYSFDVLDADDQTDHDITTEIGTKTKKRKQSNVQGRKKDGMKFSKKRKVLQK